MEELFDALSSFEFIDDLEPHLDNSTNDNYLSNSLDIADANEWHDSKEDMGVFQ
jgi:hypothetical protein